MISKSIASGELKRLSGLDYFRTLDESAIDELVAALTFADSELIAVAVVNEWSESQRANPTPADFRRLLFKHQGCAIECRKCGETGIIFVKRVMAPCSCRFGELRAAKDWAGTKVHDDDRIKRAA
jgi:hypothetical protein